MGFNERKDFLACLAEKLNKPKKVTKTGLIAQLLKVPSWLNLEQVRLVRTDFSILNLYGKIK